MAYEVGQTVPRTGRYRCSGSAKKPCMKTIVVAEGQVLPLCSACRDPRSLWFLVERSPRVESIASARSADTEAAGEQRSGIGA